jgi:hypothetical protein
MQSVSQLMLARIGVGVKPTGPTMSPLIFDYFGLAPTAYAVGALGAPRHPVGFWWWTRRAESMAACAARRGRAWPRARAGRAAHAARAVRGAMEAGARRQDVPFSTS